MLSCVRTGSFSLAGRLAELSSLGMVPKPALLWCLISLLCGVSQPRGIFPGCFVRRPFALLLVQTSSCSAMKLFLSSLTALLWSPRSCSAQCCLCHSWLRRSSLPYLTPNLCQAGPLLASLMLQGSHKGTGMPHLSKHSPISSASPRNNLHHPRDTFIPTCPLEMVLWRSTFKSSAPLPDSVVYCEALQILTSFPSWFGPTFPAALLPCC